MNFQQLTSVRETVRQGFNLSAVALALHTSQPGVSRRIRELEDELGVEIFVRCGKRLTGLTAPGVAVLEVVERLLHDAQDLRRAGDDFARQGVGTLTVAATHSQARYALPETVRDFRMAHPGVTLHMRQGSPAQVQQMLLEGEADIGIASDVLATHPSLVALPCYAWTHVVVVPTGHLLDQPRAPTMAEIAAYPLITYETGYTGRSTLDDAFAGQGLAMDVVLSAMDADVIKTYVGLGLGVGLIASIAFDEQRDSGLRALDARHLFAVNHTHVAVRRGAYLRDFTYRFITSFAPPLTPAVVRQAMAEPHAEAADLRRHRADGRARLVAPARPAARPPRAQRAWA